MKGTRPLAAVVAALALAGCKDSGLPGKNLPLQVAEHKPMPYQVYDYPQGQLEVGAVAVDGADWLLRRVETRLPHAMLVPLATTDGPAAYVLAWDRAPYDRLYHRTAAGTYRERVRVPRIDLAAGEAARAAAAAAHGAAGDHDADAAHDEAGAHDGGATAGHEGTDNAAGHDEGSGSGH